MTEPKRTWFQRLIPQGATPSESDPQKLAKDALYVLNTISRGEVPIATDATVNEDDAILIHQVAAKAEKSLEISPEEGARVALALGRLLRIITPATVLSLRDTDPAERRIFFLFPVPTYLANHLSIGLVITTLVSVLIAVTGEFWVRYFGEPLDQTDGIFNNIGLVLSILTPFTYGAMGACVYLLRSLHKYIIERTFDRRRRPEYVNRVLLGSVSGGAMVLLIDQVTTDTGDVIEFSSAVLGFLAGYNIDLLFSAIERISEALLPKVGIETVRRRDARPDGTPPTLPPLERLLDRLAVAKSEEEKTLLKELIEAAKARALAKPAG